MERLVHDLELPDSEPDDAAEPQIGVDLLDPPLVPWATEPEAPAQLAASRPPLWLSELEVAGPARTPPVPPPKQTAPTPTVLLRRLRQQSVELDPFEQLLRQKKVTASELPPGAEPTIQELSPLGAVGHWWLEAPPPSPPSMPPPPVRRERPAGRRLRFASLAAAAVLCVAIALIVLGGRPSCASTELIVPAPPPAVEAALSPMPAAPSSAPVVVRPPAPRASAGEKLIKRARAAKKWAAESWPAPELETREEPAPDPLDELKRPEL